MWRFLKNRWIIILVVIISFVGIFFVFKSRSSSKAEDTAYTVKKQDLKETLSLSGEIKADEKADLAFQTSGKLVYIPVKEGDYVKKYQMLGSLDQRQTQKTLQKYLNTYSKTRDVFDQSQSDNREVVIGGLTPDARARSLRLYDESQHDLNNSVLDVEIQNLALEYSNIYSPIEGLVTLVNVQAGTNVTAGVTQFEVINPKSMYFSASVDQTDVAKLTEGSPTEITFDAFPDSKIPGTVGSISYIPKTDETGTVYETKINFDNGFSQYRIGMTGDADFVLRDRGVVLTVPDSYIKDDNSGKYVWKLVDGKKVKTSVKVGESIDGNTEIINGLQENDIIYDN